MSTFRCSRTGHPTDRNMGISEIKIRRKSPALGLKIAPQTTMLMVHDGHEVRQCGWKKGRRKALGRQNRCLRFLPDPGRAWCSDSAAMSWNVMDECRAVFSCTSKKCYVVLCVDIPTMINWIWLRLFFLIYFPFFVYSSSYLPLFLSGSQTSARVRPSGESMWDVLNVHTDWNRNNRHWQAFEGDY